MQTECAKAFSEILALEVVDGATEASGAVEGVADGAVADQVVGRHVRVSRRDGRGGVAGIGPATGVGVVDQLALDLEAELQTVGGAEEAPRGDGGLTAQGQALAVIGVLAEE